MNQSDALIKVLNLSSNYGVTPALKNISFEVSPGELMFVSGPSGAGKTTLLKSLYAGHRISAGEIILEGRNINRLRGKQVPLLRRQFGLVFQDFKLLQKRTVFDNIALPLEVAKTNSKLIKKKINNLLYKVGMEGCQNAMVQTLSGGEQQRIAVARAIACEPRIIIADEPTSSLDDDAANEIFQLLLNAKENGATLIVSTHDKNLIRHHGGHVIILNNGELTDDCQMRGGYGRIN